MTGRPASNPAGRLTGYAPGSRTTENKGPGLLIACGALGQEIVAVLDAGGFHGLEVTCLNADLHNKPQLIADAVREKIVEGRTTHHEIFVLYADCGTGGDLDRVCTEEGVTRIPGAHCYEFYAGAAEFAALAEAEPGTFYLTDYLARHFDRLIVQGLGIDRHPELQDQYFAHYKRLVYLAQIDDADLDACAELAAERLGLAYERRKTGYGELAEFIAEAAAATTAVPVS